jgi:MFS family permease
MGRRPVKGHTPYLSSRHTRCAPEDEGSAARPDPGRAAALFYLPLVREPWQLYLFAGLFGATFFTTAPLSSTMVGQLFGPAHHGAIFGAANLFHHSAGALGSYAGGLVFDVTGSYRPIFLRAALVVVGSAIVTSLAQDRAPRPKQSRARPGDRA